ncbi:hypothetical protein Tsubulata_007909 [Turnera subulata]|uniref:Integral membrane bound transporter domain-containing protein n=1 Tax=Turnera subulata TaxID=218843 RepID=A0A9Q0FQ87_9ROSI|nr:hypothetical protein Tsubulata_007909 [Turnera subulata]
MEAATRARAEWQWCLATAFRTALACTIVGCITLYGPTELMQQITFPAFSYVTVILIVTDATLGDTLHGCWLALYATVQTVGPAILTLWLIGPARFTCATISLAVAIAAFVVVLPEGTHLIGKRIALGQIVLIYVTAYIHGEKTEPIMHPLHIAASTGVGVLACVLALLLPYPRLAYWEAKENVRLLTQNISERLKLYLKAFCTENHALASASVSQAKPLAITGSKLLQSVKIYQGSMKWERFPLKFLRSCNPNPGEGLQELEIPLRGMEMALTTTSSFPIRISNGEQSRTDGLVQLEEHISHKLKEIHSSFSCKDSLTVPESNAASITKSLQTLQTVPTSHQDLSPFFFLFCMKLLCKAPAAAKPPPSCGQAQEENQESPTLSDMDGFFRSIWNNAILNLSSKRLIPALRCSLSLGLAILFGLMFSKENGYWSGLPVAISLAAARQATFKVANVKAQGTVLGTVYGVFGCFVFERFLPIRFMSLLPWFIVTSFLRRSRMYGQAGGISAVIGAVIILGRKNFGPPSEFAIARIAETFIGLSCSIMVDLLLQPKRASSLAKSQLSKTFGTLSACIRSISLEGSRENLLDNQRRLKMDVNELTKLIGEAEAEPNFWFLPFHSVCYRKLQVSLSKMVDLLLFSAQAVEILQQVKFEASWKECVNKLEDDLLLFKETVASLAKCFEDVALLKSLTFLEKELESRSVSWDIEVGKSPNAKAFRISGEDDQAEKAMTSYLEHSKEAVDTLEGKDEEEKSQAVICLSGLGFCINNLIKETREIEKGFNELVQWENPSHHINLYEISCKIHALYN